MRKHCDSDDQCVQKTGRRGLYAVDKANEKYNGPDQEVWKKLFVHGELFLDDNEVLEIINWLNVY
jgi:hypothetical protein